MTSNQGLRVEEGKTKLIVLHNEKGLAFLHPAYGLDTYANVGKAIEKNGLARPTMAMTSSLVNGAWDSDNRYSLEIRNLMINKGLWGYTGNLYVPNEGVYVEDDTDIRSGVPSMDKIDLIRRLEANDSSVRFVPFGFETGVMSALKLAKNPYVIALASEEGAEKLAEVADKYKNKPYLWSFRSVNGHLTRVSTLCSWLDFGYGLAISGHCLYDCYGYAFGVQKTE